MVTNQVVTPEKQIAFCAALAATGGNVTRACEAIDVARLTAYRWRNADADFAALWDEAKTVGIEGLEDEAARRAFEGTEDAVYHQGIVCGTVRKYSDTLAIFLLKGAKPEKYRERQDVNVTGTIDLVSAIMAARKRNGG